MPGGAAGAARRGRRRVPVQKPGEQARVEITAGGIVFQRRPDGPYVGFILDSHGKWSFAKGHVKMAKGESLEQAAVRETQEEMGLSGLTVINKLGTTDIWFRDRFEHKGVLVHKFITYYLLEAPAGNRGRPQKEEMIHKLDWVPIHRVHRVPIYPNTVDLLRKAVRIIKREFGGKPPVLRPGSGHV